MWPAMRGSLFPQLLYHPELKLYLISLRSNMVNMRGEPVGDRRPICQSLISNLRMKANLFREHLSTHSSAPLTNIHGSLLGIR